MIKLPSFKKHKEVLEYFLSLNIAPHKTAAILFEKNKQALSVISYQEAIFPKLLEHLSQEELITFVDQVVSGLDSSVPPGATLTKTIFALPYTWVDPADAGGKITKEKLDFLKKLCEELELTPIGFLVPIEAIVAYLQRQEGVPLSAVIVEHTKNVAVVYVVKAGTIIETKKGVLDQATLTQTVERLLAGVTKIDVLPSKIILQDAENAARIQQDFLAFHWTQRLPFLHVPQVTILEKGIENEAIVNGVSAQMGFEITRVAPMVEKETHGEIHTEEVTPQKPVMTHEMATPISEAVGALEPEAPAQPENSAEALGFFEDQDIADMEPPAPAPSHQNVHPISDVPVREYNNQVQDFDTEDEVHAAPIHQHSGGASGILATITGFIPKMPMKLSVPKMPFGARLLIPAVVVILVIVGGIFAYYEYLLKADVIISSDQKVIQEDVPVTLGTDVDTSAADKTIKLSTKTINVDGSESKETTGQQETGKKATGSITIYNKTDQSKTLSKGTTVSSGNDLDFTLTGDVTIASTAAFSTSYSNADAKLEAAKFGKEYNLPSGSNFTIDGLSSSNFFGKNSDAFAGGTKDEIQVVSAKDLDALETKLTADLDSKALDQASSQITGNDILVKSIISSKISDKKFDHKEGEKASTVKLTGTVSYDVGYYSRDDIKKFASDYAAADIPHNYEINDSKSTFDLKDLETNAKTGTTSATLSLNAIYLPMLKTEELPPQLKLKSVSSAVDLVKGTDGVKDVTVEFKHQIPFLPKMLPFNPKNITITVHNES